MVDLQAFSVFQLFLLLIPVEPKGFEPLSSCEINYIFYMLIFQLIFEIKTG